MGKRGIQHQLSNFSVTIVVTTSRCWVRLNIMKSNSRRDFDLDWAFQHCSGSLQICQAQTAVQGIHGNECQGRNYLNAPQLPAGQEKNKQIFCTHWRHMLHLNTTHVMPNRDFFYFTLKRNKKKKYKKYKRKSQCMSQTQDNYCLVWSCVCVSDWVSDWLLIKCNFLKYSRDRGEKTVH